MLIKNLSKLGLLLGLILFVSCSEDESVDGTSEQGENPTSVYITDSPIDQANVEAVFITVADVKVNGKSLEGFNKTTIQISSLTQGKTELLGKLNLAAGNTSNISLVLAETDQSGNAPGNYLVLTGGAKEELAGSTEINLNDQVEIVEGASNEIVMDFDLRKSVKQSGDDYSFVAKSQLQNSVRAVNTMKTGVVTGKVENTSNAGGDVVVAYAYKKGQYSNSEKNTNSEGIAFANATSSSVVSKSNGEFEIHFLKEGDYELHFASYSDTNNDGKLEFSGMVKANSASSLDLSGFTVKSNSEVNVQISFVGLLGL
ncbi:DUF4382 domain-containing protein [Christiangramia aquimixticola]|uniref:DUF4382 domain-containing protein n=1 Tax=Christiangramia aquimixticola TaxID=1697558 RepID=UPI003AA7B385